MALSGGWWGRAVARAAGGLLRQAAAAGRERPPWGPRYSSGRGPPPQPLPVSELDKADAWLLRKAHETGFLSWFRNGLLATGVGVISYVQSDMGREAAYGNAEECLTFPKDVGLEAAFLMLATMRQCCSQTERRRAVFESSLEDLNQVSSSSAESASLTAAPPTSSASSSSAAP
uniref:Transmembrane protein 160 n=1 Tax=Sphenodon punctatus TaxID=8508 RepID=A0A8D0GBU5_SPHPU